MTTKTNIANPQATMPALEYFRTIASKAAFFRGNAGESSIVYLNRNSREIISKYNFVADSSHGRIFGDNLSSHNLTILTNKRKVKGVFFQSEDMPGKFLPFAGKIIVMWTYAHDPNSVEVRYVDTTEDKIKTIATMATDIMQKYDFTFLDNNPDSQDLRYFNGRIWAPMSGQELEQLVYNELTPTLKRDISGIKHSLYKMSQMDRPVG